MVLSPRYVPVSTTASKEQRRFNSSNAVKRAREPFRGPPNPVVAWGWKIKSTTPSQVSDRSSPKVADSKRRMERFITASISYERVGPPFSLFHAGIGGTHRM